MKIHQAVTALGLLFMLDSCAVLEGKESTKQYIADAAITRKVKTAIYQNPNLHSHEIHVETLNKEVLLSGFVRSYKETVLAEQEASRIEDVRSVHNNLIVKHQNAKVRKSKESVKELAQDVVITSKIKLAFANDSELKAMQINVETYKNIVYLRGIVSSHAEALKAEDIARNTDGVKEVKNELKIEKTIN